MQGALGSSPAIVHGCPFVDGVGDEGYGPHREVEDEYLYRQIGKEHGSANRDQKYPGGQGAAPAIPFISRALGGRFSWERGRFRVYAALVVLRDGVGNYVSFNRTPPEEIPVADSSPAHDVRATC